MEVEVNGVKYESIERQGPKMSKSVASVMMMAQAMGGGLPGLGMGKQYNGPQGVNIVEEYGLIQKKESRLSRREREWVVWKFESTFKKIEDDKKKH